MVGVAVQMAEPRMVIIREAWRVVVRPKMSATWAQRGRKEAEVRLKEEIIQFSWESWSGWGGLAGGSLGRETDGVGVDVVQTNGDTG